MITKILDFINKGIDFVQKIAWIFAIAGVLFSGVSIRSCKKQVEEKNNATTILHNKVEHFKTQSGQNATQASTWKIKYKSLEKVNGELSAENSDLTNDLIKAKQVIKDHKIKEKNVQNYIKNELISKDSIRTVVKFINCDRIKIEPVRKKHIELDFEQEGSYIDVFYKYHTNVNTLVYLEKDKDQFFLWRWFKPRYNHNTVTSVEDKNATIDNVVSIEFKK